MPKKPKSPDPAAELRHRAEQQALDRHATPVTRLGTDTQRLLHELEVHQIELEMQNAELRLARDEAETLLEKYTDLYEFAPVGYFTLAPDCTIRQVNLTGSALVGTVRSRLIGHSFALLISPEFRAGFHVFLQQVFLESSKRSMEFELINPGLPHKPVSIEVQRTPAGKECRVAVVDITGRKREEATLRRQAEEEEHHLAEQARHQRELNAATEALNLSLQAKNIAHEKAAATLRENEWRLRYATDSAKLTYVEVDVPTGGARTAENFEAVMGYAPQPDQEADVSAGSQLLLAHVVLQDRLRVATALEAFTGGEPVGKIDYRVLGDDGIERWIESRWSVELGPNGIAMKSFATNLDITERKQAELVQRHLAVLTASNQKLNQEILQRQAVEKDLHATQEAQSLLLKQSLHQQEQLRGMSHQILQVQEEERKRISRELHDVIVQTLVGISVHVADLAQSAEGTSRSLQLKIARTHRLVEKSVETVHRFARDLRPTVLDDLGLIPALHSHLKSFMEDTGIRVSLKAFAGIEESPGPVRTAIYRVAQEALVNVARHANASQVEVSIRNLRGVTRLEITDNGEGFDMATLSQAKNNNRLGLQGMKERVEMIGGTFTVESAPGKSTTVRVDIAAASTGSPGTTKRPSNSPIKKSIPPP